MGDLRTGRRTDLGPSFAGKTRHELLERLQLLPNDMELFDLYRSPRVLTNPDITLKRTTLLTESGLSEDLSCPICMGICQQVVVVKDCLHRFCSECIQKWIRSGKQVCPKCRKKIPSRRSLRPDPIFERMVRRLFPNVQDFEAKNDDLVARSNKRRSCGGDAQDNQTQIGSERGNHDPKRYNTKQRLIPATPPAKAPPSISVEPKSCVNDMSAPVKKRRGRPPGSGSIQKAKAAALAAELARTEEDVFVQCSPDAREPCLSGIDARKQFRVRPSKTIGALLSWLRTKYYLSDTIALQLVLEDGSPLHMDLTIGCVNARRGNSGILNVVLSVIRKVPHSALFDDFAHRNLEGAPHLVGASQAHLSIEMGDPLAKRRRCDENHIEAVTGQLSNSALGEIGAADAGQPRAAHGYLPSAMGIGSQENIPSVWPAAVHPHMMEPR